MPSPSTSKDPSRIAGMFDAIARRYDALNRLLSLGLDRVWRRRAIVALDLTGRERVIDVCTGTGDLAIAAVTHRGGQAREVIGIDFAGEMLRRARAKVRRAGLADRIRVARGDATAVPLPAGAADAAMVAFGIRNVTDAPRALAELRRVLRPGGRLAVLEFGAPRVPGVRALYLAYFRYLLPVVGRVFSRHREAYSYLPASVVEFPVGADFARLLEQAGFTAVRWEPLTLGIVYLYLAERP
jgi:demethylmenaquinone methyltransferase/2-methoxy-6-polyprenyl-1,4-benzoquinol methylase